MKNILKTVGVLIVTVFFLTACSDNLVKAEHVNGGDIKYDNFGLVAFLSGLGQRLKVAAKEAADQGVSRENAVYKKILELANFNIPVPKMVAANTGSIIGISHYVDDKTNKTLDSVVLDPVSGEFISKCDKDSNDTKSLHKFNCSSSPASESPKKSQSVEIATEDTGLLTALKAAELGNDKVLIGKVTLDTFDEKGNKTGTKTKDAKFVVTVQALYEGSQCTTIVVLGRAYQYCTSPINRSKP
ncbi:MAG: hypothetical protein NTX38_11415 [Methylobacter sp.]|nr:hypothetical protein [Methylobacter sp.]